MVGPNGWSKRLVEKIGSKGWLKRLVEEAGPKGWLSRIKHFGDWFSMIFIHRTLRRIHASCISITILTAVLRGYLRWWRPTFIIPRHDLANEKEAS